jgi:hypothetical protein
LVIIEVFLDIIMTLVYVKLLSKTNNFKDISIYNILENLIIFLKDGIWILSGMITATYATVFIFLGNDFVSLYSQE